MEFTPFLLIYSQGKTTSGVSCTTTVGWLGLAESAGCPPAVWASLRACALGSRTLEDVLSPWQCGSRV